MITLQNFKTEIAKVDVSKLDSTLKQGIDYVNDFGDLYNDDADIKEVIDLFLVRLNAATAKKKDFIKEHIIVAKMPNQRIEKMLDGWKENGKAFSNLSNDDSEFFKRVGVPYEKLGISSQTGNDLIYYDTKRYDIDLRPIKKETETDKPTNFSELKKYLNVGRQITLLKRGKTELNEPRQVTKVQTNGIYLAKLDNLEKEYWLQWPAASKITYQPNGFTIGDEHADSILVYSYNVSAVAVNDSTCETFDKKGERDISPAAIKKLEACTAKQPQTKDAYFKDGAYTPERQKLHEQILGKAKEKKPCIVQRQPVAILTGGPPGSGKSTWLKKYADWVESDKVYHIDADEVRAKLPEYKGWNATSTQKETKDIVNTFIDEIGRPCEFDLVYDGTMNKATSYQPLVDKLKGLGYKIFIIYISVPKEVSQQRVLERYRKMGRYVPKVVIDEVYERGLDAFDKLTKEADGFIRVDGETGKIVDKGGMPLPKKERYTKPGKTAADHDCGCNDKKHEEKCDDCKDGEKQKRETPAEKQKRVVNAEQFIKDVETNPALRKMTEGQIIAIGLDFEKNYRAASAQKRDEKHDGKKRLSPSPENLIRWMKHPGDFDLIGVDTFERKDATSDYKREISKQKFWNNIFNLKVKV